MASLHRPSGTYNEDPMSIPTTVDQAQEMPLAHARVFIGPQADYYLARWARVRAGGSRALGFNPAAFFFTFAWLIYRRMYAAFWIASATMAVLFGLADVVLAAVGVTDSGALHRLLGFLISATFGTYGSYWYYLHARGRLRQAAATGADPQSIARAGGTSIGAVLLAIAFVAVSLLLASWAEPW
jgi:hypothetical protein